MPLADARALCPDLQVGAADFTGDAAALARLAQGCGRYSPWTAPEGTDGIWLDVTGCAHLHGGEAGLAREVVERLARRGLTCRAAIADTPGTAWALAHYGSGPTAVVAGGGQRTALAPLPVAALRLDPATAETLVRLGLRRVGDLYAVPRAALARRFGTALAECLDQALGTVAEPLSPLAPPPVHWARCRFAEPITTAEAIAQATRELLARLCRHLTDEGKGARRLTLSFFRIDNSIVSVTIGTARPNRAPAHLFRLLEERFGEIDPGHGIEDMMLAAGVVEDLTAAQLALPALAPASQGGLGDEAALAALVDRLANRLGAAALGRPQLRESHLPERAVRFVPPLAGTGAGAGAGAGWPLDRRRPLRLLRHPEPVEAMAPVPDDPPLLFRWRRMAHRVRRADGPERIAGEWWRSLEATRDYYTVEDEEGRRFWVYRAGLYRPEAPPRWFMHGMFG